MVHLLSRTDVRLGLAAVVLVAVAALGVGVLMKSGPEAVRPLGRILNIAVVAPVEPEVEPGATMDVGALNDGFDRAVLDRVAEAPIDDTLPEPAWIGDVSLGDTPRMPMPTPVRGVRPVVEVAIPTAHRSDPLNDGSTVFGFDRPSPDYAAERAERQSRLDVGAAEKVNPVQYSSE